MTDPGEDLEVLPVPSTTDGAPLQVYGSPPTPAQVVRGVGGMAVLWSAGWTVVHVAEMVVLSLISPYPLPLLLGGLVRFGVWGAMAGAVFALFLTTLERRKSVDDLSLGRAALWGGVGTFAMVLVFILVMGFLPVLGVDLALIQAAQGGLLGGASAALTTWLAQRAPDEE